MTPPPTPAELAIMFHDTYERLAPSFGYETRSETRKFDPTTPNGRLMIAVCGEILASFTAYRVSVDPAQARVAELESKLSVLLVAYNMVWRRLHEFWNKEVKPSEVAESAQALLTTLDAERQAQKGDTP